MHDEQQGKDDPRWEYKLVWRYGPIVLVVVGLAMMGCGAAGLPASAISLTLLPLGFICLIAGVVLPRIEGGFSASPKGVSANLAAVHDLDRTTYIASGPALAAPGTDVVIEGPAATGTATGHAPEPITLGDVWDALDAADFRPVFVGMGSAILNGPDGRQIKLPNRSFLDYRTPSDDLLALLASWGIRPAASGNYPVPPYAIERQPLWSVETPDG